MSLIYVPGVAEFSGTVGAGPYVLSGALANCFRFAERMTAGDQCYYWATNDAESEFGLGTFAAPNMLLRSVEWSSNNDLPVIWLDAGRRTIRMLPPQRSLYPIAMFLPGRLFGGSDDDRTRARIKTTRGVTFPPRFAGSDAEARVEATLDSAFDINRVAPGGAVTAIGSLTFLAGATRGQFTTTADAAQVLNALDMIELVGAATADDTLADLAVTFDGRWF